MSLILARLITYLFSVFYRCLGSLNSWGRPQLLSSLFDVRYSSHPCFTSFCFCFVFCFLPPVFQVGNNYRYCVVSSLKKERVGDFWARWSSKDCIYFAAENQEKMNKIYVKHLRWYNPQNLSVSHNLWL